MTPTEAMLRATTKAGRFNGTCRYDSRKEPVPASIATLYKERAVLLKVGDFFLRTGTGSLPLFSRPRCSGPCAAATQ